MSTSLLSPSNAPSVIAARRRGQAEVERLLEELRRRVREDRGSESLRWRIAEVVKADLRRLAG